MNIQSVGSVICRALSQGIGVGVRTPSVSTLHLSNVLGRVSNSSAASPAANIARGASGIGNSSSGGVVGHLSGVRGGAQNPASLMVPPMAQRAAMAYYHSSSTGETSLAQRALSNHVILPEGGRGEDVNTAQNKNANNGNLPLIAQRLMAELARHEEGKANRDPIAPESPMGKELQSMVSKFEALRNRTL